MNEVKDIIEIIPEETRKEIYSDGIKPAIIETGKAISLIPRTVKNLFSKVEMWNLNREYMVEELKIELENKLMTKKAENIVEADLRIFVPVVQALGYSWEKEEIKSLYINLMSADMDSSTKDKVHPGFTEIIKQMDSTDVKTFTKIYEKNIIPLYILKQKQDKGTIPVLDYLLTSDFYNNISEKKVIKSLNNLERLKLINIIDDKYYVADQVYQPIENGAQIIKYKAEFLDSLDVTKGMIKKTEFGNDFYNVCCK